MPVTEVKSPFGEIIEVEHPDGATDQEILDYAQENHAPITKQKAFAASQISGIPFGADIAGAIAATGSELGMLPGGDTPFMDKQRAAKQFFEERAAAAGEQYPGTAIAGSLTTGLPIGMLIPKAATSGPTVAARALKGGATTGAMGALYGAGQGSGDERVSNAITQGVMSAPFGVAGSLAVDAIGAGYRATRGLAQRAAKLLGVGQGSAPNIVIEPAAGQLDDIQRALQAAPDTDVSGGRVIPVSKGQETQSAKLISQELDAASGVYGEQAQNLARKSQEIQTEAAKSGLSKLARQDLTPDAPLAAAEQLKKSLNDAYNAAKARTNIAYKKVGELAKDEQLLIAKNYIDDAVIPQIDDWVKRGATGGRGWDLTNPDMPRAAGLYKEVSDIAKNKNITSLNFFRMEDWRSKVSQAIASAKESGRRQEVAFLSGMLERFDTSMSRLPREAIKSGDEAIISAMEAARTARKTQGVLFERSRIVRDVLENEKLTNEQFYNTISSLGPKSGAYVRDILRTAANDPAKQSALKGQIKQSTLGSILNKSLSNEIKQGSVAGDALEKMVSFDRLATELNKLIGNKTLFNQLFDDAEKQIIRAMYRDASLIKSRPPGSYNSSNTYTKLLSFLRTVSPTATSANVLGIGVGNTIKAIEQTEGQRVVEASLAPILHGISKEATGPVINFAETYGRNIIMNSTALSQSGALSNGQK